MTHRSLWHSISAYVVMAVLTGLILCPSVLSATTSGETLSVRVESKDFPKISSVHPISRVDYGAFSVIEVSRDDLKKLKSLNVRVTEEADGGAIRLAGRTITKPAISAATGEGLYLVRLAGPTKPEWQSALENSGAKVISYIPENSYLVWMSNSAPKNIGANSFVKWFTPFLPAHRVGPRLGGASGKVAVSVGIYSDTDNSTLQAITKLGAGLVSAPDGATARNGVANAVFWTDAALTGKIAELPKVVYVDLASTRVTLDDEVACQINARNYNASNIPTLSPNYRTWLTNLGFDGTGTTVAVVDSGCDTNEPATIHPDLRSRILSIPYIAGTYSTDRSGHGTHVAGIIAGTGYLGTTDSAGFLYGLGVAPGAGLVIQNAAAPMSTFPPTGSWEPITRDATQRGAIVSNNSWSVGSDYNLGYTADCKTFDELVRDSDSITTGSQPLALVFSIGNFGPDPSTIPSPKEAKNIITVGASENYRPDNPLGSTCSASSNITGVAALSSRGPCADGRLAPTLVAPGTNIASTRSSVANPAYKGDCQEDIDSNYTWMSGTSMAAPMVTGGIAIIDQWWRSTHNGQHPSPALLKAMLVNSAVDLAGGPDGRGGTLSHIPNNDQGWGRLDIANAVNPPNTFYEDQVNVFTGWGQFRKYRVETVDPAKPLKVTLVWTDAPQGIPGANGWTNDLDLTVTKSSTTYLGNVFSNGWSATGGSHDYKNNVECVYIENPSGVYEVSVNAANIVGNAIPGNQFPVDQNDQDYAIVIRNGRVGGTTLQPYAPVQSATAPAPDHYVATRQSASWSAAALLPSAGTNSDLAVYVDPGYTSSPITADATGQQIDIVAIDGNRETPTTLYPRVNAISGSGGYTIQWAPSSGDLVPGVQTTQSFGASDLIRMWDVSVPGQADCAVRVQPTSGNLDLGVCIFGSTAGQPATYYRLRSAALCQSGPIGAGITQTVLFQLPTAGRYGVAVWKNSGTGNYKVTVDTTPPTAVVVTPPSKYSTSISELSASWQSSDPETGITKYDYAVGTSPGASDIVGWTNVGSQTSVTCTDLTLDWDTNYFFTVKATNGLGMSTTGYSTAIRTVRGAPTINSAKQYDDYTTVMLAGKSVTAIYSNRFYIEETNRSGGIQVKSSEAVSEGQTVTVVGQVMTDINGERYIDPIDVIK